MNEQWLIIGEKRKGEQEQERADIHLLSVNLFSEMFFGLRIVNWVIMADC